MSTLIVNNFLDKLKRIDEIDKATISLREEKRNINSSLSKELDVMFLEGNAEDIIDLLKNNDFYISIDYKTFNLYFSCNLHYTYHFDISDVCRTIDYLDHKIDLFIERNTIHFKINESNTIGFYLRIFNKNLDNVNCSELEEFDKEGILKIIENVDKVKSIFK